MLKERKLLIFGTGTLAELATYYFNNDSDFEVVGYIHDDEFSKEVESSQLSLPIYSWSYVEGNFDKEAFSVFVAIGYRKMNKLRAGRLAQVINAGFSVPSYVSSRAVNFSSNIGRNCFILENNVLQPFTRVMDCVTMWSGNHIGHHSTIFENAFLTSHVVISGNCKVGANSFLGVNSTLHDGVQLGDFSVVGAGAVVSADSPPRSVFAPSKSSHRIIERDLF